MLILALDTTTRAGSLALARDGEVIDLAAGDPLRTHGERLPGEVQRLLARNQARATDVDLYAVAAGPGSFTGLRVGIAVVQGLAFAMGRRVVAVSALDMLARIGARSDRPARIGVWMDAQRAQVFAALYQATDGAPVSIQPAVAQPPEEVLRRWEPELRGSPVRFIGDGAERYRDVIRGSLRDAEVDTVPLLAPEMARFAYAHASDAVPPHAIVPIYVRPPDAELARDRKRSS